MDPSTFPNPTSAVRFAEIKTYATAYPTGGGQQQAKDAYGRPSAAPVANLPPPAASNFAVQDGGNCGPRYLRSTLNVIPCTADLLKTSNLPMCVCIQPLAEPRAGEKAVPIVDYQNEGPLRCRQCKAYLSCMDNFISGGREYRCALCNKNNAVPQWYFSPLDARLQRTDMHERPELCNGSVEYVATKDYMLRPPEQMSHVFVVDVSQPALASGLAHVFANVMRQVLRDARERQDCSVGIITFDSTVHFYDLNKNNSSPEMLVVPDIGALFLPMAREKALLVSARESHDTINALLESFPSMFSGSQTTQAAMGAAVQAAAVLLRPTGGKVYVVQRCLLNYGPAALKNRMPAGGVSQEKEGVFFKPQSPALSRLGEKCAEDKVGVDLFLFGPGYTDVTSMNELPRITGGETYYYPSFPQASSRKHFEEDLYQAFARTQGYDAIMRVRTSEGLGLVRVMGNGNVRDSGTCDVEMACIDSAKVLVAQLKHTRKLAEGRPIFIQAAMLYTTQQGERRIRVHNLALDTSTSISSVFRGADLDAVLSVYSRSACEQALQLPVSKVRQTLIDRAIVILSTYRKLCAQQSASAQLILPETLKLLPVYVLGMLKHPILSSSRTIDERSAARFMANHVPLDVLSLMLYPRLFDVLNVPDGDCTPIEGGAYVNRTPPLVRLQAENLRADSVYLMDCGRAFYLWVGPRTPPAVIEELVGTTRLDVSQGSELRLLRGDPAKPILSRVHAVMNTLRNRNPVARALYVISPSDPANPAYRYFTEFLVEDRTKFALSYVDFLCHVHRQIQQKMAT